MRKVIGLLAEFFIVTTLGTLVLALVILFLT
jgi:hypothetical protein